MVKRMNHDQLLMEGLFNPDELQRLKDMMSTDAFTAVDEDLATDYRCPHCGYEWSGAARPPRGQGDA